MVPRGQSLVTGTTPTTRLNVSGLVAVLGAVPQKRVVKLVAVAVVVVVVVSTER